MVQVGEKNFVAPIEYMDTINGVELHVKREDLLHPEVSGNKWYKLVYHIERAKRVKAPGIATFGGAYSNHLLATAAFASQINLESLGLVRGEPTTALNPTLARCEELGMELIYLSRSDYRRKTEDAFLAKLRAQYPEHHFVPEGGGGMDGIRGAELMMDERCAAYDIIACAVGTGTTAAGLALASLPHQEVWGIPVHKHSTVIHELEQDLNELVLPERLVVEGLEHYHFGGYAKWTPELLRFIRKIKEHYDLPLDPIYTGKALFGVMKTLDEGRVARGKKLLFIHTGGLQGIAGFEARFDLQLFEATGAHKKS